MVLASSSWLLANNASPQPEAVRPFVNACISLISSRHSELSRVRIDERLTKELATFSGSVEFSAGVNAVVVAPAVLATLIRGTASFVTPQPVTWFLVLSATSRRV